tara:strand:+ start:4398 stop:4958 length:561 start_codon:yes stop_codon:yes gene_type:complete
MLDNTSPDLQEYFSRMERPLPGESLTEDPDVEQPYTGSTEFVVAQEAIDYIFDQMTQEENYIPLMDSIVEGTTIMEATRLILFSGFNEGKFNPDLMLLLVEPVAYMIMGLAERAGIEYVVQEDDEEDMFGVTVQRPELSQPSELSDETQMAMERVEAAELPERSTESLMARPPPQETPSPSLMQRQ